MDGDRGLAVAALKAPRMRVSLSIASPYRTSASQPCSHRCSCPWAAAHGRAGLVFPRIHQLLLLSEALRKTGRREVKRNEPESGRRAARLQAEVSPGRIREKGIDIKERMNVPASGLPRRQCEVRRKRRESSPIS